MELIKEFLKMGITLSFEFVGSTMYVIPLSNKAGHELSPKVCYRIDPITKNAAIYHRHTHGQGWDLKEMYAHYKDGILMDTIFLAHCKQFLNVRKNMVLPNETD